MREESRKRAALHNLGCKVNAYETEAMRQMLEEAGYEIVPFSEKADLYVVNTCTVTNVADKKSRQMIHRARKLNPEAVIVAAGCYVQISPEKAESDEAVDIILGNNEKQNLLEAVREFENKRYAGKMARITNISRIGQPYEELHVIHPEEHTRAFVKVEDGCSRFCSYCIIPFARGPVRSRQPEHVLREVETLAENGFLEIVLTGINLSAYGSDLDTDLLDLISMLNEVEGIKRIRLGSLDPEIISEEFVSSLAGMEKICPHFHLSLQSGSDTVLSRMNRNYTTAEYMEKCGILRRSFLHPALTTDIITGFPGETEEEFEETCSFVKRVGFYELHVFPYARREGTAAALMEGQISGNIKAERTAMLLEIAAELKREFESWYEGRKVEVLLEEPVNVDGKKYYVGYTPEYLKVRCPAEGDLMRGGIKTVEFFPFIV